MDTVKMLQEGLNSSHKHIPFWYLYDKQGCILFEKCWSHNQYHYMSRTEKSLLQEHVEEILDQIPEPIILVDMGCGNCDKTRIIIDAILDRQNKLKFIPIDMSKEFLLDTLKALETEYGENLDTHTCVAEYADGIKHLRNVTGNKLILWFGGLQNLSYLDQTEKMKALSHVISEEDRLVLTLDVTQDPEKIKLAYLDPSDMQADFYKNGFFRLNRDYEGNFDIRKLKIEVEFTQRKGQHTCSYLTMRAKAVEAQTVNIPGLGVSFALKKGQYIDISDSGDGSSCKYTVEQIQDLVESGQLMMQRLWVDKDEHIALCCIAKGMDAAEKSNLD